MKYWSLVWAIYGAAMAFKYVYRHDWLMAALMVAMTAVNHGCYNLWNKDCKESESK